MEVLQARGTCRAQIERVPGAHEVPAGLSLLAASGRYSRLPFWRGNKRVNSHHHLVAESAGHAIQSLVVQHRLPINTGIVVTDDLTTAEERITGRLDRGSEFPAALEMASFRQRWTQI